MSRNSKIEKMLREDDKKAVGRPAGSVSPKNKVLRTMIEAFTDDNFDVFVKKMNEIEKPEMYSKLYIDLLSFRMPKLKSIDFNGEIRNTSLDQKLRLLREDSMSSIEDELDEVTEDEE